MPPQKETKFQGNKTLNTETRQDSSQSHMIIITETIRDSKCFVIDDVTKIPQSDRTKINPYWPQGFTDEEKLRLQATKNDHRYFELLEECVRGSAIPEDYLEIHLANAQLITPTDQELREYHLSLVKDIATRERVLKYMSSGVCWLFRGLSWKTNFEGFTEVSQVKMNAEFLDREQQRNNKNAVLKKKPVKKAAKYRTSLEGYSEIQLCQIPYLRSPDVLANPNMSPLYGDRDWLKWGQVPFLPEIPIIITEGAKKAMCMMAHGYLVIALPGVWQGRERKDKIDDNGVAYKQKEIIDPLKVFLQEGRQFYFVFDNDPYHKTETRENVGQALSELSRSLMFHTKVEPKVITWEQYEEKGADDLIAAHGIEVFHEAFKNAVSVSEWECKHYTNLYVKEDISLNCRYIPDDLSIPENKVNVIFKSLEGTGKSHFFRKVVKDNNEKGILTFILTPRDALKKNLSKNTLIPTDTEIYDGHDISGKYRGMVVCFDSIWKVIDYLGEDNTSEICLILDEATQSLHHLYSGKTQVSHDRVGNILRFKALIDRASRIYWADADLNTTTYNHIRDISPGECFYIANHFKYDRVMHEWTDKVAMLNQAIIPAIARGERVLILTQGQQEGSTVGTHNLELALTPYLVEGKGGFLRGDSTTVDNPEHPAYKCPQFMNELVHKYQVIALSPTFGTGFSIDEGHGIDKVFTFCLGVGSPMDAVQFSQRVRGDDVERHIFINTMGTERIGNGAKTPKQIRAGFLNQQDYLYGALKEENIVMEKSLENLQHSFNYLTKWGVIINSSCSSYRTWTRTLLGQRGYRLQLHDESASKSEKQMLKAMADEAEADHFIDMANAPDLTEDQRQDLISKKRGLTDAQRNALTKANFKYNTGGKVEVTPENLRRYTKERILSHWQMHFLLMANKHNAAIEDAIALEKVVRKGKHFLPETLKRTKSPKILFLRRDLELDIVLNQLAPLTKHLTANLKKVIQLRHSKKLIKINDDQKPQNLDVVSNSSVENLRTNSEYINSNKDQLINLLTDQVKDTDQAIASSSDSDLWFAANHPLIGKLLKKLRKKAFQCKALLGFTPSSKHDITLFKQLLAVVGLSCETDGRKTKDSKSRLYKITGLNDGRFGYWEHLVERSHDCTHVTEQVEYFVTESSKPEAEIVTSIGRELAAGYLAMPDSGSITLEQVAALGREVLNDRSTEITQPKPKAETKPKGKQLNLVEGYRLQNALERGEYTQVVAEAKIKQTGAIAPTVDPAKPPSVGDWVFVGGVKLGKLVEIKSDSDASCGEQRASVQYVGADRGYECKFADCAIAPLVKMAEYLRDLVLNGSRRLWNFVDMFSADFQGAIAPLVELAGVVLPERYEAIGEVVMLS